jgi:hypothetical protein
MTQGRVEHRQHLWHVKWGTLGRDSGKGRARSGSRAGLRTPGTLLVVARFPVLGSGLARSAVD